MDLITTHLTADLDGIASMVALWLLEGPAELCLPGAMDPTSHRFWSENAAALPPLLTMRELRERVRQDPLRRLRVGDTADPARIGLLGELARQAPDVLCWDNHPVTEQDLPRAPMPDAGACTSVLVLELARRGITPTPVQASLFLLGIHVDTGHFTYPGTTALDHEAAARCHAWGAPADLPRRYLPKGFTARQLELLETMAASVERWTVGPHEIPVAALEAEAYEPDLSTLLEQLREAEAWPSAFLLVSQGPRVAIIGRSDGTIDVGALLRMLGGGGHPEAASAVLRSATLLEARALLKDALQERLERRWTAGELAVRRLVHVAATASISTLAETLHQARVNAVPLSEGEGESLMLVGLVSRQEADAAMRHHLGDRPAIEISAGPPAWVSPEASLTAVRHLLITDGRRLVAVGTPPGPPLGVLTRGTLFRAWEAEDLARPDLDAPPPAAKVAQLFRRGLGKSLAQVERVGRLARELEMSAWLVGGCVRDLLLGRAARDIDLVIEGDAMALAQALARRHGGRALLHEAFGTAHWEHEGHTLDLATARVEWYEAPASLPKVAHAELRRDLYRRDFTINAMAISLDPESLGALEDPFGGARDLRQGLLRVLHGLSFHDDPTRAFRAARFAARFDFRLAPQTEALLQNVRRAGVLDALGRERLGVELDRLLDELEVLQAARLLRDWELLPLIHPQFVADAHLLDRVVRVTAAVQRVRGLYDRPLSFRQADPLWLVIAAAVPREARAELLRMVPGDRHAHRRWLDGPERVQEALSEIWTARRPSEAARALLGLDLVERVYALGVSPGPKNEAWLTWWEREGQLLRASVNGQTMLARGVKPGPALGLALRAAQDAAWDGLDAQGQLEAAEEALRRAPAPGAEST